MDLDRYLETKTPNDYLNCNPSIHPPAAPLIRYPTSSPVTTNTNPLIREGRNCLNNSGPQRSDDRYQTNKHTQNKQSARRASYFLFFLFFFGSGNLNYFFCLFYSLGTGRQL